jgi:hypothetical protein
MISSDVALTYGIKAWKRPCRITGNSRLPLDAFSPDCCFSRGQCCISDKTAHTSAFDFGSLIDEFAFIIGEVNECFFSKARLGSPTRCGRPPFCHKQMVSPNFLPLSPSTGAVQKSQRRCKGGCGVAVGFGSCGRCASSQLSAIDPSCERMPMKSQNGRGRKGEKKGLKTNKNAQNIAR